MRRSRYRNRAEAGRAVLAELSIEPGAADLLVVGLARGGVPVAAEVARGLGCDLEVAVVRKLGVPGHEELALGAITRDRMVLNHALLRALEIEPATLDAVVARERHELSRRETAYRGGRPPLSMAGRIVVLVDDGIATGASMRAVALDAHAQGARQVIIAVPTAPETAREELADVADQFICPHTPCPFIAVGMSYADFGQTTDDEVRELLR